MILRAHLLGDLRWKIVKQKKEKKRLETELKLRHFLLEEKKIATKMIVVTLNCELN